MNKLKEAAEEWRPVVGFEGLYEVSTHGRVRRLFKNGLKKLKIPSITDGYPRLTLFNKQKCKTRTVHRLVAEAFLGIPTSNLEAAHMDGDRLNCHISNLKFVTRKENHSHMKIHGTLIVGEDHPRHKLTNKDVIYIRKNHIPGKNTSILAKKYGVNRNTILNVINKNTWKHMANWLEERLKQEDG